MNTKHELFGRHKDASVGFEKPTNFSPDELKEIIGIIFHPTVTAKNRLSFFFVHAHQLSSPDVYGYALRLAYERDEVTKSKLAGLIRAFEDFCMAPAMMEKKEWAFYLALPERITLHKVLSEKQWQSGLYDLSWYLREISAFHPPWPRKSSLQREKKRLYSTIVPKQFGIACLNQAEQGEILLHPHQLKQDKCFEVWVN